MPDPLDLLDQQVHGFGRSVGAAAGRVEGEDLGLPSPDRSGEPRQLRDPDAIRPVVEACQRPAGIGGAVGGVDAAQQLLALPGGHHLAGRIPESKPSPQPHSSPLGQLLLSSQQQLADAIQRIWLAAPMPRVACWVRRRTWSTTVLASLMAWKWSTTTVA